MTRRRIALHLLALALLILGAIGAYAYLHSRYAVPSLIRALEGGDADSRLRAAANLARLGPWAMPAVDALLRLAQPERTHRERSAAAGALVEISPAAAHGLIPGLTQALRHADARTRYQAGMLLAELGPVAGSAIPALASAARDPDEIVRRWAITALGRIGIANRETKPALVAALIAAVGDPSTVVQHDALLAFSYGHLPRDQVEDARAALTRIAADPRAAQSVRSALQSLERLRKPEIELLVQTQALRSGGAGLRYSLPALASLGPAAAPAVAAVAPILDDARALNRYLAVETLAAIGPAAASALPALRERLRDEDALVRAAAAAAIAAIDAAAPKETPR